MNHRNFLLGALIVASLASAALARKMPLSTLVIGPNATVDGQVASQSAKFLFKANGPSTLILNPDAAVRFGLKTGFIGIGLRIKVGPVGIAGNTSVTRYSVNGYEQKKRIAWFVRPVATGYSGTLGPSAFAQNVVTLQLRPSKSGEQTHMFPLVDRGYLGVGTWAKVGKQQIFVQWDMSSRHSSATAAAGAALAASNTGQFVGKVWQDAIAFGVERPVRRMTLSSPFRLGPLHIDSFVTRTTDYGDTRGIPDADADQNEIVVLGKSKSSKAISTVAIGTDAMVSCSSITFNKKLKQILLRCS
jgi:hypothetical protein